MVRLCYTLILFSALIFSSVTAYAAATEQTTTNSIDIQLAQINTKDLEVSYTLTHAIDRLELSSTSDQSRAKFWRAKSEYFELVQVDKSDFIKRIDGKPFRAVTFIIDIVDISIPNYYRPFSPLYDKQNGVVLHTGQYFVCANVCDVESSTWQVHVRAEDKNIVHHDGSALSVAAWQDSGDGRSVYVGPKSPIESDNLVSLVDPGLPSKLKTMLDTQLPDLLNDLGKEFPGMEGKPLVFATYNNADPNRWGHQGGVLNKTVFMHWWGPDLAQRIDERGELWFFAHEIAHFYQHQNSKVDVDEVAWIHEGFAELMAAELLAQTNNELKIYVQQRFNSARTSCAAGLKVTPIGKATQLKQFDLHYKCGLLLHRFISQNASESLTVFELWNMYRAAIDGGKPPSKPTYLNVVQEILPEEDFVILNAIVGAEIAPDRMVDQFLEDTKF